MNGDAYIQILGLHYAIDRLPSGSKNPRMWHCHGNIVDDPPILCRNLSHIQTIDPAPGDGRIIV